MPGVKFNTKRKLLCHKVSDEIYSQDKCEVRSNQRFISCFSFVILKVKCSLSISFLFGKIFSYQLKIFLWFSIFKFTPILVLHVSSLTRRGTIQQKWGFCSKACGLNPKNVSTPLKVRINWSLIAWQCNKVTYNPGNAN